MVEKEGRGGKKDTVGVMRPRAHKTGKRKKEKKGGEKEKRGERAEGG